MRRQFVGVFDEHDFFRARKLTRAVDNNGEFQVLLEGLKGLLPVCQELTDLLGLFSAILNRAQPNQNQKLIAVLESQVCLYQAEAKDGHDSSHSERAAMGLLYAGVFDEHAFFRARKLTRAVDNHGEFQVLLKA